MPRGAVKDAEGKGKWGGSGVGGRILASDMIPFAAARAVVQKLKMRGESQASDPQTFLPAYTTSTVYTHTAVALLYTLRAVFISSNAFDWHQFV